MYSLFWYANWYRGRMGVWGIVVRFPARERGLFLLHSVKTGTWANQASYSMVKQDGGRAVSKVDHSTHLMPRLPISGALLPLPRVPSWHVQGQLRFCCCKSYGNTASHSLLQTSRNTFRTDILGRSHSRVDTSCRSKPVVKSETREELNIR